MPIDQLSNFASKSAGIPADIFLSLCASAAVIITALIIRRISATVVIKRSEDVKVRYRRLKALNYAVVTVAVLITVRIWSAGFQPLATFLGLLTAAVVIALQDLVRCAAGWLFLIWRKPFVAGDRIQIGDHAGDVIDIRLFQFSLAEIGKWVDAEQTTGRILHIPNSRIFTDPIANYTRGFAFIWNEIPVLITFESSWQRAKQILFGIISDYHSNNSSAADHKIRETGKEYLIYFSKLTPAVYTSTRESGILLTIRYIVDPRQRRNSEEIIWESILTEFGRCRDISLAYPSFRVIGSQKATAEKQRKY